jgi:hypothetical protein
MVTASLGCISVAGVIFSCSGIVDTAARVEFEGGARKMITESYPFSCM